MAEKGIVVSDDGSGESVACRDAIKQDDDSNNRIIQLFDKAARPVVYHQGTPIRSVSSSDTIDLSTVPSDIYNNLLDVSDAESVVVWAGVSNEFGVIGERVFVTPIVMDENLTLANVMPVACLPTFEVLPVYPKTRSLSDAGEFLIVDDSTKLAITAVQAFPTFGAKRIGFHVTFTEEYPNIVFYLYAAASSSAHRNTSLDQAVTDGVWGADWEAAGG